MSGGVRCPFPKGLPPGCKKCWVIFDAEGGIDETFPGKIA